MNSTDTILRAPAAPTTAPHLTVDEMLDRWDDLGGQVRRSGTGWAGCCLEHDDRTPSVMVTEVDGRLLVFCHVCSPGDVEGYFLRFLDRLNGRTPPSPARLDQARRRRSNRRSDVLTLICEHVYRNEAGRPVARKARVNVTDGETGETERSFRWSHAVPANHGDGIVWLPGLSDVDVPLYRLSEIREAIEAGRPIYVTEGESDCEALVERGLDATSPPHGASRKPSDSKWSEAFTEQLKGAATVMVCADNDPTGIAHAEHVRASLTSAGIRVTVLKPPYAKDVREHLDAGRELVDMELVEPAASSTVGGGKGRRVMLTAATDIRPRPVSWLWPDRLPVGAFTLLAGREGIGKSLILVYLTAQLTRGTLPGARYGRPAHVFIATSEDAWEYTMVPRLMAAGADLDLVHRVQVMEGETMTGLTMPTDLDDLRRHLLVHEVALLALDPLTSTMDGKIDAHLDRQVRLALEPLAQTAEQTGTAVLGIVHLGKSSSVDPVNLILGSRAFAAVARLILVAARDPEVEGEHILSVEKSNVGRLDARGLRYKIEAAMVDTDEGPASVGRTVWMGETDQRVRDLMASTRDERDDSDEAAEWLRNYLVDHGGEAPAGDILRDAAKDGVSADRVRRARRRVGVGKPFKVGMTGPWMWQLDLSEHGVTEDGTDALGHTSSLSSPPSVPSSVTTDDAGPAADDAPTSPDSHVDRPEDGTEDSEDGIDVSPATFMPPSQTSANGLAAPAVPELSDVERAEAVDKMPERCVECGKDSDLLKIYDPHWTILCVDHLPPDFD